MRRIFDIFAEFENSGNTALTVHYTACAESITDALVNTVSHRDHNVLLERFETADTGCVDNIFCTDEGFFSVESRFDLDIKTVSIDISLAYLRYHIKIAFIDIVENDIYIRKFGNS